MELHLFYINPASWVAAAQHFPYSVPGYFFNNYNMQWLPRISVSISKLQHHNETSLQLWKVIYKGMKFAICKVYTKFQEYQSTVYNKKHLFGL